MTPTDQQIVDTLARHGIGWGDERGVTAYPLDGEDAPIYIAAIRELLASQPAQEPMFLRQWLACMSIDAQGMIDGAMAGQMPRVEQYGKSLMATIEQAFAQLRYAAPVALQPAQLAAPVAAQEPRTIPCPICEKGICYESRHFKCLQCEADLADPEQARANKQSVIAARNVVASQPAQGDTGGNPHLPPEMDREGALCRPHSLPDCMWCRREAEASQPAQGERHKIPCNSYEGRICATPAWCNQSGCKVAQGERQPEHVWLVWKNHSWDAPELHGVFSDEAAADAFVASKNPAYRFSTEEQILRRP